MAITFSKQPLKFFNVNEPAIFEFSSDTDLGVPGRKFDGAWQYQSPQRRLL